MSRAVVTWRATILYSDQHPPLHTAMLCTPQLSPYQRIWTCFNRQVEPNHCADLLHRYKTTLLASSIIRMAVKGDLKLAHTWSAPSKQPDPLAWTQRLLRPASSHTSMNKPQNIQSHHLHIPLQYQITQGSLILVSFLCYTYLVRFLPRNNPFNRCA